MLFFFEFLARTFDFAHLVGDSAGKTLRRPFDLAASFSFLFFSFSSMAPTGWNADGETDLLFLFHFYFDRILVSNFCNDFELENDHKRRQRKKNVREGNPFRIWLKWCSKLFEGSCISSVNGWFIQIGFFLATASQILEHSIAFRLILRDFDSTWFSKWTGFDRFFSSRTFFCFFFVCFFIASGFTRSETTNVDWLSGWEGVVGWMGVWGGGWLKRRTRASSSPGCWSVVDPWGFEVKWVHADAIALANWPRRLTKKNQKRKEKEQGLSPRTNQRPGPTHPPTPFHPLPHLPPVKGHVVKEIYLERKRKDSNTKSSRNGTTFVEIGQVGRRFRFFFF